MPSPATSGRTRRHEPGDVTRGQNRFYSPHISICHASRRNTVYRSARARLVDLGRLVTIVDERSREYLGAFVGATSVRSAVGHLPPTTLHAQG